ncbi:MAG TPA: fluoride efflux transporter CrcB [Saprospiraceae bacterium]|nr:fluoride efflux transporter CrcB [Saprospiraceae bacterium]
MKLILIIGIGSFLGGIFRFGLSQLIQGKFISTFPYGTLGVNIIGCLVIGVVIALSERTVLSAEWRLFLATGICGGFTTYSAFSGETFSMLRDGQFYTAAIYILSSLILGVLFTFIGYSLPRFI